VTDDVIKGKVSEPNQVFDRICAHANALAWAGEASRGKIPPNFDRTRVCSGVISHYDV
jgi:hypothetical protein